MAPDRARSRQSRFERIRRSTTLICAPVRDRLASTAPDRPCGEIPTGQQSSAKFESPVLPLGGRTSA